MARAVLLIVVVLALSACGKKGDLKPPASAGDAAITSVAAKAQN